jgi:hypothetical protein
MPDNWEIYKDWKELMENIRKKPQEDNSYDDDVTDLTEQFRDYID